MTLPQVAVLTGAPSDQWACAHFAPEEWPPAEVEVISSAFNGSSAADVLVVGPSVAEPLAAARAFRRLHPSGQVVFVTASERLEQFCRMLPFAPEVAEAWVLDAEIPRDELKRRVDEAREVVRSRQAIKGLYSRINAQVGTGSTTGDAPSQRQRQHQALAERYLAAILTHAPDALVAVALDGAVVSWNEAAARLFGRSWDAVAGEPFSDLFTCGDRPLAMALLSRASLGESVQGQELRISTADDAFVTLEISAGPVLGAGRAIEGISLTARDVTERKRWEEHQRLLINELNHRVKNTLATVQSIASQTLRNAPTIQDAKAAFEGRLMALSRAHDVLTRETWEGANLSEIVAQAVEPYRNRGENRLHLEGPEVRLPPRMALGLAMALQELATNAVKYGGLSNATGEIRIGWKVDARQNPARVHLRWEESGGPPVHRPPRRGFGSRLIERSLVQDLDGRAQIEFAPTGVICTMDAPIA